MTFLKRCKTGLLAFWPAPKNHGKSGLHHEHVAPHEKTERRGMSFPIPRPRGKDMPSAKPLRKTTNTSSNSAFGPVKTLDRLGRQTVSLAPRTTGAIAIEGREQGAASTQKRAAILRGISVAFNDMDGRRMVERIDHG